MHRNRISTNICLNMIMTTDFYCMQIFVVGACFRWLMLLIIMLKCALMQMSKSRVRAMCFLHSVYHLPQKREKGFIVFS